LIALPCHSFPQQQAINEKKKLSDNLPRQTKYEFGSSDLKRTAIKSFLSAFSSMKRPHFTTKPPVRKANRKMEKRPIVPRNIPFFGVLVKAF